MKASFLQDFAYHPFFHRLPNVNSTAGLKFYSEDWLSKLSEGSFSYELGGFVADYGGTSLD